MHTDYYLAMSNQNSDFTIRFSDPDFLKKSNNLAVRRRFHAVMLTFDQMTLNVCSTSGVTWSNFVPNFSKIEQSAAELLAM